MTEDQAVRKLDDTLLALRKHYGSGIAGQIQEALLVIEKALSEHEKARPLLEAAKRADIHSYYDDRDICSYYSDQSILRAALTYKETTDGR
ncbi:MAG: hypothetical protein IMZ62_15955 [Chloroflexi bacterium]|nr:hypothetical protein [Chloroflexota bacterium]